MIAKSVLVLGAGYTGRAVLRAARERGLELGAVVRRSETALALAPLGVKVIVMPRFEASGFEALVDETTLVVVTFPPDGETDARVAQGLPKVGAGVLAIGYVSSTGVYGDRRGVIDDTTPVSEPRSEAIARRLGAEGTWRGLGATILRCPSIYGPDRGLHVRIAKGEHRLPGDGRGFISRIHVVDLANHLLATPRASGETFVVGDEEPAAHRDVAAFVCATHRLPEPPSVPLETVHESLRGDRRIDGARARALLGVTLRYRSYREGMGSSVELLPVRA